MLMMKRQAAVMNDMMMTMMTMRWWWMMADLVFFSNTPVLVIRNWELPGVEPMMQLAENPTGRSGGEIF